jgi:predicted outer membrane protein
MNLSRVCLVAVFTSAALFSTGELKAYAQAPSDPQIAGIVQTTNQIDINQAKLALKKRATSRSRTSPIR